MRFVIFFVALVVALATSCEAARMMGKSFRPASRFKNYVAPQVQGQVTPPQVEASSDTLTRLTPDEPAFPAQNTTTTEHDAVPGLAARSASPCGL